MLLTLPIRGTVTSNQDPTHSSIFDLVLTISVSVITVSYGRTPSLGDCRGDGLEDGELMERPSRPAACTHQEWRLALDLERVDKTMAEQVKLHIPYQFGAQASCTCVLPRTLQRSVSAASRSPLSTTAQPVLGRRTWGSAVQRRVRHGMQIVTGRNDIGSYIDAEAICFQEPGIITTTGRVHLEADEECGVRNPYRARHHPVVRDFGGDVTDLSNEMVTRIEN
jgi:hypothetical protein